MTTLCLLSQSTIPIHLYLTKAVLMYSNIFSKQYAKREFHCTSVHMTTQYLELRSETLSWSTLDWQGASDTSEHLPATTLMLPAITSRLIAQSHHCTNYCSHLLFSHLVKMPIVDRTGQDQMVAIPETSPTTLKSQQ